MFFDYGFKPLKVSLLYVFILFTLIGRIKVEIPQHKDYFYPAHTLTCITLLFLKYIVDSFLNSILTLIGRSTSFIDRYSHIVKKKY